MSVAEVQLQNLQRMVEDSGRAHGPSARQVLELYDIPGAFIRHGYGRDCSAESPHYQHLMDWCRRYRPYHVLEFGTQTGASAVCMAQGAQRVTTADVNIGEVTDRRPANMDVVKLAAPEDCLAFEFSSYDLVFVDIDHSGKLERELHETFQRSYRGFVMWDDISIDQRMKEFWREVRVTKFEPDWHPGCGFGITFYGDF